MKPTNKRENRKPKIDKYMSHELFGELIQSLDQALQFSRGEQINARITVLPAPPSPMSKREIIDLRQRLNLSQAVFAHVLDVIVNTLQSWKQGLRLHSDAALKLLPGAKQDPEVLLS